MANKLKTKPKNTNRYLKGLSLVEMDDVEESVESALENPGGTFAMVSKEHSFKLSALSKTVKSISGDTKYIRKTIDKMHKKMDEMQYSSGSGNSPLVNTAAAAAVAAALRSIAASVAGLYATEVAKKIAINEIDKLRPSDKAGQKLPETVPVFKIGGGLGTELAQRAAQVAQEWLTKGVKKIWSGSDAGPPKSNTQIPSFLNLKGNTPSHRSRLPAVKAPGKHSKAPAMNMNVALAQFNTHAPLPERSRGFKELTPTERAEEIAKRLKGMTQIPGLQSVGFAGNNMPVEGIPNARGSLGGRFGPGRPSYRGYDTGTVTTPAAPDTYAPSAVISNGGIEGTRDGGRVPGKKITGAGGKILTMEEQMAYIEKAAIARGLDPNVALTIAKREGLKGNGNNQAGDRSTNLGEYTSFGPYQLHYGYKRKPGQPKDGMSNYGLGDEFTKQTGLDARDPTTVTQQIDFALDHMAKVGHSRDWHGFPNARFENAKPLGITPYVQAELPPGLSSVHTATKKETLVAGDSFNQAVSINDDVARGKVPYISGHDFAIPVFTNGTSTKPFDEDLKNMTPEAIERIKQAAIAGKAAGLTKLELYGAQSHSGHVSHGAGTEFDIVGYNANGSIWSRDQRALTGLGPVLNGDADRLGLYGSGRGLHVGKADEREGGPNVQGAWGPGGKTSGVSVDAFAPGFEKQVASFVKGQGPVPVAAAAILKDHNDKFKQAKKAATQTAASTPKPKTGTEKLAVVADMHKSIPSGKEMLYGLKKDKITSDTAEMNNLRHRSSFTGEGRPQKFAVRGDGEGTVAGKVRSDRSTEGLFEKAKTYAMNDDINNPARAFPTIKKKASLPLTPGATEGKSDKLPPKTHAELLQEHETIKERNRKALQSGPSRLDNWRQVLDGTMKAPTFFPKLPDGARENLVPQIQRPVPAAITPEKDWNQTIIDGATATAEAAMEAAQNATKSVYDWMAGQKATAPPAANRIPPVAKNPPPLSGPPRTFHKATQTTNPTAKSPGSDSSKSFGTSVDDPASWQYPAEMSSP